jgi:hypothetical protein
VTGAPERAFWRVGYHADPAGFVPVELCTFNHRFDDVQQRFRSIYAAELSETALREVLADLRPKAAAIRRYVERFGPDAADDVPALPVTASWRQQHVLVQVRLELDGPLIDLCDTAPRAAPPASPTGPAGSGARSSRRHAARCRRCLCGFATDDRLTSDIGV